MEEILELKNQIYVLATSSLADQRTRVLKHGESFAVFDAYGNIQQIGHGTQGLYDNSTRFLSCLELRLDKVRPLLLSSNVKTDNSLLTVDLMNRETADQMDSPLAPGTLHIFRSKFIWNRSCFERVRICNFSLNAVDIGVYFRFKSDFADIFEIRGTPRDKRGETLPPQLNENSVMLSYQGLDKVNRKTLLEFYPTPTSLSDSEAHFLNHLPARGQANFYVTVSYNSSAEGEVDTFKKPASYAKSFASVVREARREHSSHCKVVSSNVQFNEWVNRSVSDLHMMVTETPHGQYPYAGVPLFNTVFGRDGIITALQALWLNPHMARGVLNYLAATQMENDLPDQDAEPGKILHEVRTGEMVGTGIVPFKRYYGSADATPLFIILAAEYFLSSGDLGFISSIWTKIEKAIRWMDVYGDQDRDGFIEYSKRSERGLQNQGWKDSFDSISHENGSLAEGPIALCEIQAYAYRAKRSGAILADALGIRDLGLQWRRESESLREKFEINFWSEKLSMYALALDGEKKQCEVRSSNAGHCLFGGIASAAHAEAVAHNLMGDKMFSGWGVRTLATSERRYNPMSYHNGSVWPHDNGLIAIGLADYGFKWAASKMLTGFFEAARFMDLNRLPELFCGFSQRQGEGPTLYPVACAPQSWASGSLFMFLTAVLGLTVRANPPQIRFHRPVLPAWLEVLDIKNLRVGNSLTDIRLTRHGQEVAISVLRRQTPFEVVVTT